MQAQGSLGLVASGIAGTYHRVGMAWQTGSTDVHGGMVGGPALRESDTGRASTSLALARALESRLASSLSRLESKEAAWAMQPTAPASGHDSESTSSHEYFCMPYFDGR